MQAEPTGKPALQTAACYLHRGIASVEFFDYPLDAMPALRDTYAGMKENGYDRLGFHAPMPRLPTFLEPGVACYYLHDDPALRRLTFEQLELTLQHARQWQADYVVTHLTYGRTDTTDPHKAESLAAAACRKLAELSRYYEIPINIEFAAYTRSFNQVSQYLEAIAGHPELGFCIDTGHTMLGASLNNRDYFEEVAALAPSTRSMHLWNTRGEGPQHVPLHPVQTPAAGWIDIERTLRMVLSANPDVTIIFEYPVADVTDEIQAGYDWVTQYVKSFSENNNSKSDKQGDHQ